MKDADHEFRRLRVSPKVPGFAHVNAFLMFYSLPTRSPRDFSDPGEVTRDDATIHMSASPNDSLALQSSHVRMRYSLFLLFYFK